MKTTVLTFRHLVWREVAGSWVHWSPSVLCVPLRHSVVSDSSRPHFCCLPVLNPKISISDLTRGFTEREHLQGQHFQNVVRSCGTNIAKYLKSGMQ